MILSVNKLLKIKQTDNKHSESSKEPEKIYFFIPCWHSYNVKEIYPGHLLLIAQLYFPLVLDKKMTFLCPTGELHGYHNLID